MDFFYGVKVTFFLVKSVFWVSYGAQVRKVGKSGCTRSTSPTLIVFFFILPRAPLQGCYIGQESISRVNAYNAVKAGLYGVAFEEAGVPEGAELVVEETGKR